MAGYFPIDGRPYRLAMGLTQLKAADWIEIDADFADDLRQKRRLLAERRDELFQELPGAQAGQREVLDILAEHLPCHHPETFHREGSHLLIRPLDEWVDLAGDERPPLETAGRLVQEDLCLMERVGDAYRLTAAAVCFPTRWNMRAKMGQPLAGLHGPVPGFNAKLELPVDRFFELIKADKPVQRVNWSLMDDPALHQPRGHGRRDEDPTITADNAGERLWLRIERQTLRRLPATGGVVFGIRIHTTQLAEAVAVPERASRLLSAVRSMPEGMRAYKSMPVFGAAVEAYLERRATGA